jgi:hypothetical protein
MSPEHPANLDAGHPCRHDKTSIFMFCEGAYLTGAKQNQFYVISSEEKIYVENVCQVDAGGVVYRSTRPGSGEGRCRG